MLRNKLKVTAFVLLLLLILAPIAWHVIYSRVMERRWQANLDVLREAGEPVTLAELAPPPVPDNENAAPLYLKAMAHPAIEPDDESYPVYARVEESESLTTEELKRARLVVATAREPLEILREASRMPRCRFPRDYDASAVDISLTAPEWGKGRQAFQLLQIAARVHLADGKADEAVADCLGLLKLARADQDFPLRISLMVEYVRLRKLHDDMQGLLDGAEPSASTLQGFLGAVGDVEDRARLLRALKGERCWTIAFSGELIADRPAVLRRFDCLTSQAVKFSWAVLGPLAYRDRMAYLGIMGKWIRLADKPYHERGLAWRYGGIPMGSGLNQFPWGRPFTYLLDYQTHTELVNYDRRVVQMSSVKLAVALRLCRLNYGRYPDDLAALVPEFLDKLPTDPFSGKEFIYRKEGQGFVVYSVGVNGTDDGGVEDAKNRDAGDIVWKCSR